MSVQLRIDLSAIDNLHQRIAALAEINTDTLLEGLGAEAESQSHRRIRDEKTAPDGTAWQDWKPNYAKTREAQHSILIGEGDLDESIENQVEDNAVYIGSPLVYAAVQDQGYAEGGIVQRQIFGFSDDNIEDLQAITDDFIDAHIKKVLQ